MTSRIIVFLVLAGLACPVVSETTYRKKPFPQTDWECDSLFVGAGLVAKDSSTHVVVTLKNTIETFCEGALYFMVPGYQDSARFLFHNIPGRYSGEPTVVNLGVFPAGTPLYFRYAVTDTILSCANNRGVMLYSGENDPATDPYISGRASALYGKRWAAVGRIDDSNAEIAFDGNECYSHRAIICRVAGVSVTK